MNSKGEIRRILGIFNVCKSVCLGLSKVVEPLQSYLNARQLPKRSDLQKWVHDAWSYILKNNMQLSLQVLAIYDLQVDWSSVGYGYLLYLGASENSVLVGLNSKGAHTEASSSFLGKMESL